MYTKQFVLLLGGGCIFFTLVFSHCRIPVAAAEGWQHPPLPRAIPCSRGKLGRSVIGDEQRLEEEG